MKFYISITPKFDLIAGFRFGIVNFWVDDLYLWCCVVRGSSSLNHSSLLFIYFSCSRADWCVMCSLILRGLCVLSVISSVTYLICWLRIMFMGRWHLEWLLMLTVFGFLNLILRIWCCLCALVILFSFPNFVFFTSYEIVLSVLAGPCVVNLQRKMFGSSNRKSYVLILTCWFL